MEKMRMMESPKRQSYRWWFGNHNAGPGRSQWLQNTLSELDEKTKAMMKIIEEDADSLAQRAEMFYKKRPQLVTMVEDFYRAHRSLAEQFDHLRHDPNARRASPLARSFSVSATYTIKEMEQRKSCDSSFSKMVHDSEDLPSYPLSKGSSEKSFDLVKPLGVRHAEIVYDSEESLDSERSEVDDPASEVNYGVLNVGEERDLMSELVRLREENMIQKKELLDKDKKIEELNRRLRDSLSEVVMKVKEEAEKFKLENVDYETMNLRLREESLIQKRELVDKDKKILKLNQEICGFLQETMKMKEEAEKLKVKHADEIKDLAAENAALQKSILKKDEEKTELMKQLEEKNEEKRETIRQMSFAVEVLKGENQQLKKSSSKRWDNLEFEMLKEGFGNMFNH